MPHPIHRSEPLQWVPFGILSVQVGDYFGELSLISNAPRAASIVTSSSNVQVGRA